MADNERISTKISWEMILITTLVLFYETSGPIHTHFFSKLSKFA